MTATPGFLKTLKTVAGKKLRGIRDSIPQGYLLGRASSGNGPPELISMDSILAGIKSMIGGIAANPTATASDVAVNGTATTFMRSDAAPAVQKTSAAQFGLAKVDGTTITAAGGVLSTVNNGTVTSVGLTMPAEFTVTGSPVTSAGTLAVAKATQAANTFYAGPTSGAAAAPAFRALSVNDPSGWGFFAGSIPFMTATGIAQNNAKFFWDNTNGRLSLETILSGQAISINSAFDSYVELRQNQLLKGLFGTVGTADHLILGSLQGDFTIRGNGGNILFSTDSGVSVQLYLKNGGNIGVGTTAPAVLLDVSGPLGLKVYTVAALPPATAKAGQLAFVSDATLTAITGLGLAPTGGGTNFVPVYSDGAGWKII